MTKPISNAVLMNELKHVKESVDDIKDKLDKDYVTQKDLKLRDERISLLQKIVYGIVGLVLTGVALTVLNLVLGNEYIEGMP